MKKQVNRALIIGLGGTGTKCMLQTKIALLKKYGYMPESIKLMAVDTDLPDIKTAKEQVLYNKFDKETGASKIAHEYVEFNDSEMKAIPIKNPHSIKDLNYVKKWIDPAVADQIQPSSAGAGQVKMRGRFAFFENYKDADVELKQSLSSAIDTVSKYAAEMDNSNLDVIGNVSVFLVFSPCGGTGAGTYLDFAMLIRHITQGQVKLNSVMVMPGFFKNFNDTDRVYGNAYASFKEIDHLMGIDNTENGWSNHDPENPYNVNYEGIGSGISIDTTLFDLNFVFDNVMKNGKTIDSIKEVHTRIGDFLYEMVSGGGDSILQTLNNNHDVYTSANRKFGFKRRNYFTVGLGHLSVDSALVSGYRNTSLIKVLSDRYKNAKPFNAQQEVEEFLNTNNFNELGDAFGGDGKGQDQLIDQLFNITKDLLPLGYKGMSSLLLSKFSGTDAPEKTRDRAHTQYSKIMTSVSSNITDKKDAIKERFTSALKEKVAAIMNQVGGVENVKSFLSILDVLLDQMSTEMLGEKNNHQRNKANFIDKKTGDEERNFQQMKDKLNNGFFGFLKDTEKAMESACKTYVSRYDVYIKESINFDRKEAAHSILIDWKDDITDNFNIVSRFEMALSELTTYIARQESKYALSRKNRVKFDTDLSHMANNIDEIPSSKENENGRAEIDTLLTEMNFGGLALDGVINDAESLYEKLVEKLSDNMYIKNGEKVNIESVLNDLDHGSELKHQLHSLTNSAEPCGKVDESFAAETMKQPGTIKLFTVPDDKTTILNRKEAKDHMKLGAAPKFIKNADINRLTMLKLNGPFPINAISTFTEMRDQYYKHKELNEPELHIDTFFKDNAQDLLESLSVEDALMYFGLATAMRIVNIGPSRYTITISGSEQHLGIPGGRDKKNRKLAFNIFKDNPDMIDYVKNYYEDSVKEEKHLLKTDILNYYRGINDQDGGCKKWLGKGWQSLSDEERSHIHIEVRSALQKSIDDNIIGETDLRQMNDGQLMSDREWKNFKLQTGLKF